MAQQVEERRSVIPYWVARAIEDTHTDVTAVTGGLGSGKTTGSALWFIDRWLLNRNSQFSWAVAPTHTKIEQILLPAVRQVLFDVHGMVEDVHYRIYKGRFFKLVAKGYKHEIHFLSGDRPGLFVGSNVACLWVTEPGLMLREVFEKGQTRLRCPKAVTRQAILEGTPEGLSGKGAWWAELANVPGVGFDRRGCSGVQKGVRRFIVETTHNKHLRPSPEEYAQKKIRDVFAYDKNKVLSYEKGLFVPFTRASAYHCFVESQNIDRAALEPSPYLPVELSWDFNVSPLAWVASQQVTTQQDYYSPRKSQVVALHESSGDSQGLYDACLEFGGRFPLSLYRRTPIRVHGDCNGHARSHKATQDDFTVIEQYLRAMGYANVEVLAPKSNPEVRVRLERVNALLSYQMVLVSPRCQRLVQSLVTTAMKEGTFQIEKPAGETHTHYADAWGYSLCELFDDTDIAGRGTGRPLGATF